MILIGAGIGLIVDYGLQVRENMKSEGMRFWDAVYHKNIDESSMASSAVGGGVGAATMSILAPATVLQSLAAGGAAGWLSGRASALTEASWNQAAALLSGPGLNGKQFLTDAVNAGIIDPTAMLADTATGSVVGGIVDP